MLTIHACLQQYLLLLCTMNIFLSFIEASTDKGLNFNHCSNSSDITKPIVTSGGILILKLNDIKIEKVEIDKDAQLKKMIEFEKERQLTRLSTLYYKRIYHIICSK